MVISGLLTADSTSSIVGSFMAGVICMLDWLADCGFDFIHYREFHGRSYGHAGLHPDYQRGYLDADCKAEAMRELCKHLTNFGVSSAAQRGQC